MEGWVDLGGQLHTEKIYLPVGYLPIQVLTRLGVEQLCWSDNKLSFLNFSQFLFSYSSVGGFAIIFTQVRLSRQMALRLMPLQAT